MLWVLVPVKEMIHSKQRLARVLDSREREGLVLAMLRDVLTAIRGVDKLDGVLLVSRSQEAQALARDFVNDIFPESVGSDHSRAVAEGNRYLIDRYEVKSSLAISADLPRVTSDDIRQIIEHHECVSLVPNATGEACRRPGFRAGCRLLARSPPPPHERRAVTRPGALTRGRDGARWVAPPHDNAPTRAGALCGYGVGASSLSA